MCVYIYTYILLLQEFFLLYVVQIINFFINTKAIFQEVSDFK